MRRPFIPFTVRHPEAQPPADRRPHGRSHAAAGGRGLTNASPSIWFYAIMLGVFALASMALSGLKYLQVAS